MKIDADMSFRKLEIFIAFMACGNIARTAEQLSLSNVSVHRALHTLEENIRCPLFIHQGRNLKPLPAAHTLLEYALDAVDVMAKGITEARNKAGLGQKRMRIGTLYSLTLETVPRLIMGMKLRRPDLELDLTMGSNQLLLEKLQQGELDAILLSVTDSQIDRRRHEVLPLFEDTILWRRRRMRSWATGRAPICAITASKSSFRWRRGSLPFTAFRRRSALPVSTPIS